MIWGSVNYCFHNFLMELCLKTLSLTATVPTPLPLPPSLNVGTILERPDKTRARGRLGRPENRH